MNVLFVCLGNICRSPLAEGIFLHLAQEAGRDELEADSAGTGGYHEGEPADSRSIAVGERHGVAVPSISRKVRDSDFEEFDLIVAMDAKNLADLKARCPSAALDRLVLMRDYDPEGKGDVPDPYYGGPRGFDDVYDMLERSCRALLATL